jgi:hypothetical protein
LSGADAQMLSNIVLCVEWPTLRSAGVRAGANLYGGHFGPFRRQNMRSIGCHDMSLFLSDIDESLQKLMRPLLRFTKFKWNATFIGIGCRELELLQLPASGYAYIQVVRNPGGGSVINLTTKTVLNHSGTGIVARLTDIQIKNGHGMCLMVMYHSFVDVNDQHRASGYKPNAKQCVGGNSDGAPAGVDGAHPVAAHEVGMYNLVQACCEPNNLMKRPSRYNEDFNIIEITEREDFRSVSGRLIATKNLRGPHDTLFFTAPLHGW